MSESVVRCVRSNFKRARNTAALTYVFVPPTHTHTGGKNEIFHQEKFDTNRSGRMDEFDFIDDNELDRFPKPSKERNKDAR